MYSSTERSSRREIRGCVTQEKSLPRRGGAAGGGGGGPVRSARKLHGSAIVRQSGNSMGAPLCSRQIHRESALPPFSLPGMFPDCMIDLSSRVVSARHTGTPSTAFGGSPPRRGRRRLECSRCVRRSRWGYRISVPVQSPQATLYPRRRDGGREMRPKAASLP